jgi:hypothetical protein
MLKEVVKKSQENQAIHLSHNFRSWPQSRQVCHDAFTFQGHMLSTLVELMKSMVQWESCDTEAC